MRNKTIIAATALAFASTFAYAQQPAPQAAASGLSMIEVLQKLESEGYTAFEEIDRDRGVYEVSATSPNGTFVEIEVDSNTGEVLRSERDD